MRFLAICSLIFVFGACEKKKADLSSDKAKYSYAIGHQIGRNFKMQNIELDVAAFAEGVEKQLKGEKPAFGEPEMREFLKKMSDDRRAKEEVASTQNKELGQKFLDSNKSKEGVKVTASGLQYKVLREADGKKPKAEDTVEVHYVGRLIDGTEFDSSYDEGKSVKFPLRGVIPGWTEGLQLMPVGAKYEFVIPSEMAYGSQGNPRIPPNSVLIFEVELLDIVKSEAPPKPTKASKKK